MPGSIHLSVIEWIDVPSQESISIPHFLKVYMGKKEFRSIGKESFSFPVISLRDNLMIMLCDVAGNLITKTELRTILIAEKGETEVIFPLEFRKDVKLRLKFILSEEEKEKIREMRNSALKRKHEELLKSTHDPGTSAMQAAKDYTKKVPKRLTETDQTTVNDQKSQTMVKESSTINEQKSLTMVKESSATNEHKSVTIVKQDPPIDQKLKPLTMVKQGNIIEEHKPLSMVKEARNTTEEHKPLIMVKEALNTIVKPLIMVKKALNTIEKPLTMVKEGANPIDKALTMVKQDNTIEDQKPIVISNKRNMIDEKKSLTRVKEGNEIEKNKLQTMVKESKYENVSGGNKRKSAERSSSDSIRKMISAIESNAKQKPGQNIGLRTKGQISKITSQNSFENEDIQQERRISQTLSRRSFSSGNLSEAILQNEPDCAQIPLINEAIMFISNEREDLPPDFAQRPLFNEKIMFISNEREDLPPDFEQGTQFNEKIVCISNLNEENNERHEIREVHEIRFLRNYEKFTKGCSNNSFQIFDINMPRHLCLTTGPKQLRNMIGNFHINLASDEEQKSDDAELEEESKEIEIKNQARQNFGNSILNGLLIDKGARILIVIIAFGTIIFKSR